MGRWYRLTAASNRVCGRFGAVDGIIEAAIDRAIVEGYTRVPDDDEFDGLAEASIRILNEDDPW